MKTQSKVFVCAAACALIAAGCAEHRNSVSYNPDLSYPPTSGGSVSRIYAEPSNGVQVTPPPGATSQDWALAQEIQNLLMANQRLGRTPIAATVNNGVVTLHGEVATIQERDRLREAISQLPGVQRVDDSTVKGMPVQLGPGEAKHY